MSKPPAQLPRNKTDTSSQISRAGSKKGESVPPKRDSFQQAAVKQVLVSNSVGDGLWCYQKENATPQQNISNSNLFKHDQQFNPEIVKRSEKIVNQKTQAMNAQMESGIIDVLEKQCNDLGIKMELQSVKLTNQNIQILQLQQSINAQNEKSKEAETEIYNLRQLRINLESQVDSIKDLYNKAKREASGLSSQLEEERTHRQDLQKQNQQLEQIINKFQLEEGQESEVLRERLEEIEQENEDLKSRLQIRGDIEKRFDQEQNKQQKQEKTNMVRDKELKLEKMGKLLEENATLGERLLESDTVRRKFMERNQASEKEIKQLIESKIDLGKQVVALKRRVNDLTIMKSTNNKILEDKITQLKEQGETTQKENEKYKKFLQNKVKGKYQLPPSDEEEEEAVQAKPQLFGA